MYGYIYKTTNLINNKIYIGQKKSDIFLKEKYLGSGKLLKKAIEKYGKENFNIELIYEAFNQEDLDEKEVYYISQFNARNPKIGYNLAIGGASGDSGYHLGMLGKHQSDYQKRRVAESTYTWTSEQKMCKSRNMQGNKNGHGNKNKHHVKHWNQSETSKQHLKEIMPDVVKNWHKNMSEENKKSRGNNISKSKRGTIVITDGIKNRYIKPEDWDLYKEKGFYKMSVQKYKKEMMK